MSSPAYRKVMIAGLYAYCGTRVPWMFVQTNVPEEEVSRSTPWHQNVFFSIRRFECRFEVNLTKQAVLISGVWLGCAHSSSKRCRQRAASDERKREKENDGGGGGGVVYHETPSRSQSSACWAGEATVTANFEPQNLVMVSLDVLKKKNGNQLFKALKITTTTTTTHISYLERTGRPVAEGRRG